MPLVRNNQQFEYTVKFAPVTVTAASQEEALEKAMEKVEPNDCVCEGLA